MFYSILDISFRVMQLSARYAQFLTQQRIDELSFGSYIFFCFYLCFNFCCRLW